MPAENIELTVELTPKEFLLTFNLNGAFETAFEQLAVYFIYRHLANKRFEHSLKAKTSFAILSVKIIKELCNLKSSYEEKITLNDLIEFTRLYSSEIEYSEENMQAILSWLEE